MGSSKKGFEMNVSIIFAITLCYLLDINGKIYGEQISIEVARGAEDKLNDEYGKRSSPGMWFGPRLGKRSNTYQDRIPLATLQQWLIEAIAAQDPNIVVGSKRQFTPRLGRDSSEQDLVGPSKSIDFVPRLGRDQPRPLLKTLLYGSDMNQLYSRALSDDNRGPTLTESKVPPFAPRLGRELSEYYVKN